MNRSSERREAGFDIFRQVIAFSTSDSWARVPHVAYSYEANAERLLPFCRSFSESARTPEGRPLKLSVNTLVMKIIAEGLVAAPQLNAHLKYSSFTSKGRLTRKAHVDMTIPWLLPSGKVVSVVVPRVEQQSLAELQASVDGLGARIANTDIPELLSRTATEDTIARIRAADRVGLRRVVALVLGLNRITLLRGEARRRYYAMPASGRLDSGDVATGSVVVSNIGSLKKGLRGQFALLDVISPMVFAVGISAIQEKPWVVKEASGESSLAVKPVLPLCLAFDHRAFEFSAVLPFIERVEELMARPELLAQ
jgi:Pyruvate/2-oxoglutarate dehydrogenase complex, dihydrolipoamide acyltransferase (E2) component, and related enzymes